MIQTKVYNNLTWYVATCLKDEPRSDTLLGTLMAGQEYLTRKFPLQGAHRVIIHGTMIVNGVVSQARTKTIPQDMAKDCLQYVEAPDASVR